MHDLLDYYAHSNGLIKVNPRLKLLLGGGSILFSVSASSPLVPLLVAVTMSMATLCLARIPWRVYSRLILIPLSFALLSSLVVMFVHGVGAPIFSISLLGHTAVVNVEGANLALLLMARTMGGMCSLFFIALTTPMVEIFSILRYLRVPEVLLELSMLIYRYIFVLLDEAVVIRNAQEVRLGYSSLRSSLHSFSMLASVLFLRSWEKGEQLMVAMDSRCYDGKLEVLESKGEVTFRAMAAVLVYLTVMVAVTFFSKGLVLL